VRFKANRRDAMGSGRSEVIAEVELIDQFLRFRDEVRRPSDLIKL
jgi:hypothetical protein